MNQTQQPQLFVNNILLCYERETHIGSDSETVYTDGSKNTGRKVGFVAVFAHITRRGSLRKPPSIQLK